ncbi:E3 ubiquitin-protein ligase RHA2A-like [Magnolia sinica]|uniref:E3 ubiquitin-protein ligase RHA2A-like n=1 Tax=Magnolia sinica TaxID=86752 RepID=UPI0026595F71|nr:E3 ubiquitin-protein ligase RHA2A-like [Magnolia sinica]
MDLPTPSSSLPFLPIFILCISTLFLLSRLISQPLSSRLRLLARAHFTWAPNSPFDLSNSEHFDRFMMAIVKELNVRRYKSNSGPSEAVECVVCLSMIEEGEEIREISCDHLFHRVCLDRWLGYRHATCPLCRGSLIPMRFAAKLGEMEETEEEMLLPFSFLTTSIHSTWWLR